MWYTWKRMQWLMAVFVWCCQPSLLFPGLLMWLIHDVFTDTNRLLRNVWPKIKLKGMVRAVECVNLHITGKRKGVGVWGLEGTLMMGWCSRWPQTWKRCKPLALGLTILHASHCYNQVVLALTNIRKYSLDLKRIPATCPASLCPLFYLWPCAGMCWAQPQQENCDLKDRDKDRYSTSILQSQHHLLAKWWKIVCLFCWPFSWQKKIVCNSRF